MDPDTKHTFTLSTTALSSLGVLSSSIAKGSTAHQLINDTAPIAALCSACQRIFEGEWAERESLELSLKGNVIAHSEEALDSPTHDDCKTGSLGAISTADSYWYENPDWVKVNSSDTQSVSFISPKHHAIPRLESSALDGCALCTLLKEIVFARIEGLDENVVAQLVGIAVVRPSNEHNEGVVLEVAYFIDGEIEQEAYQFGVELLLFPCQVTSAPSKSGQICTSREFPSAECLEQILSWLRACGSEHLECPKLESSAKSGSPLPILPSRLLKLQQSGSSDPHVSLCETARLNPQTRYIALSHCWGKTPIIRLLTKNYEQFTHQIAFPALSKTFKDAVQFTIALRIEYIWIDSLCIIQDSAEDWRFEASLMCSVYSNAWVTLAATSSSDGNGGLFHTENKTIPQKLLIETTWKGHTPGVYICIDKNAWDRQILHGPLNTRAWVLQEQILSPKTIHCAYDQIWWSCSSTTPCCNETFPGGVPAQTTFLTCFDPLAEMRQEETGDLISLNESWASIVQTYTQRDLTYGSDKLVALAGIAEAASQLMGVPKGSYLAGLWRCDIIVDLLWRAAGNAFRPEGYRAPSWSWASIDGEAYFHSSIVREKARNNSITKLIEAQVTPVQDVLGSVSTGYIILEGPLLEINLSAPDTETPNKSSLNMLRINNAEYDSDSGFAEALDHEPMYHDWPADGKKVYFACFTSKSEMEGDEYSSEGIILLREDAMPGVYHRIGWLRVFHPLPFEMVFKSQEFSILKEEDYLRHLDGHNYVYKIV